MQKVAEGADRQTAIKDAANKAKHRHNESYIQPIISKQWFKSHLCEYEEQFGEIKPDNKIASVRSMRSSQNKRKILQPSSSFEDRIFESFGPTYTYSLLQTLKILLRHTVNYKVYCGNTQDSVDKAIRYNEKHIEKSKNYEHVTVTELEHYFKLYEDRFGTVKRGDKFQDCIITPFKIYAFNDGINL